MSLQAYAQENIFAPLGMNNSHFHDNLYHIIPNRAFGYQKGDDSGFENLIMRFDLVGSGGLYSTVEDFLKWDQNFYKNQLGQKRQSLIDTMLTDGKLNNGKSCGYAFALVNGKYRGQKTVSHTGALGGYRAVFLRFPDQAFSVVILSNLANFQPAAKAYQIADVLLAKELAASGSAIQDNDEAGVKMTLPNAPDKAQMQPYIGTYYSAELDVRYRISESDGKLFMKMGYQSPEPLTFIGDNQWRANYITITFPENQDKAATRFQLDSGRVKGIRFTRD